MLLYNIIYLIIKKTLKTGAQTFIQLLLFWFVGFGADGYYGMKFVVGAKVMDMKAYAGCEPYGGVSVWGELGIGLLLYGKLRLEGNIMDMGFPTTAEIEFKKFPLDVQLVVKLISKNI